MVSGAEPFLTVEPLAVVDEFTVSSTLQIGPSEPAAGGAYQCIVGGFNPDGSNAQIFSNTSTIIFTCRSS